MLGKPTFSSYSFCWPPAVDTLAQRLKTLHKTTRQDVQDAYDKLLLAT